MPFVAIIIIADTCCWSSCRGATTILLVNVGDIADFTQIQTNKKKTTTLLYVIYINAAITSENDKCVCTLA